MDIKQKKARLAKIKDEVAELHPLLEDLLPRLENIEHVEYTHGPNELGADFVLEKRDTTLSDTVYVGVVVKVGKIHQDLRELDRQIEECGMPRLIRNGAKNIYLSEIWILTNDTITRNAREKINHKFSARSIHFLAADTLIKLIDKHCQYFWHPVPTLLGTYLLKTWEKNDQKDKTTALLPNSSERLYIDLDVAKVEKLPYQRTGQRQTRFHTVNLEKEVSHHQCLLIEGEMGAGKSKLIRTLVGKWATPQALLDTGMVPVVTSYRNLLDTHSGKIKDCLMSHLGPAFEHIKKIKGRIIVFIDGLDEVIMKEEFHLDKIQEIVDELDQLKGVCVVMTSRPLKLPDYESGPLQRFTRYKIQPLSLKKILKFIERICTEVNLSKRLIEDIKHSQLFRQLPQSPIAAILFSRLLMENAKELPSNITELYSKALELMLGRWDIEKDLCTPKEYEASQNAMGEVAEYMITNGLTTVARSEAKEILSKYVADRNLDIDSSMLFDRILARSEVLVSDDDTGVVFFSHRSFAEFLYAKRMLQKKQLPIDHRAFDLYWMNTYFFYVGLHKDCPDLLGELLHVPVTDPGSSWRKVVNIPNYLLAGFLSPYSVVTENLYKLFVEVARLFLEVREGKMTSNISNLSEMQALWIVQYIIRQSYAYDYFRNALEGVALQIHEETASTETKAFALFFLGVVSMDLGEEEPFKFLLSEYDLRELPMSVNWAIDCETRVRKEIGRSPLMKKHHKRLRRMLKDNRSLQSQISNLFGNPMVSPTQATHHH